MNGRLSIGEILRDAWALYRGDLFVLTAVPFVGNLAIYFVGLAMQGFSGNGLWLDLVFGPVIVAVTIVLARDASAGLRHPFAQTMALVMRQFARLVLLSFAAALVTGLGLVLLVVPGLYAAAVLLTYVPLVLFADAGWGALAASYRLSRSQAWPLVGLILVLIAAVVVAMFTIGALVAALQGAVDAPILWRGVLLLMSAAITGVYACVVYVVYDRLAGAPRPDVAEVFR
jgi:hypothetical protein